MRHHTRTPHRSPVRVLLAGLLAIVGTALTVSSGAPVSAAVAKPFTVAFNAQIHGGVVFAQNTVLTCNGVRDTGARDDAGCAAVQQGAGTHKNNNNWRQVHVDIDGDPSTVNSSSAPLRLPDGVEVLWAGLYWGAALSSTSGFPSIPAASAGSAKIAGPGSSGYTTVTAEPDDVVIYKSVYQASAVVTDLVRAGGAGTYTIADVPAAQGSNKHGGWTLAVVYEDPSRPLRDITIFDGFAEIYRDPVTVQLSGLRAPVEGAVDATVGIVAYEGDDGAAGDYAMMNRVRLSSAQSPGTNFFNSRIETFGSLVTEANPSYANNLGFDVKVADATGVIPNSATSASVTIGTSGDQIFLGLVSSRIDLTAPRFPDIKSVANLTGHDPTETGDTLRYTLKVANVGDDPADTVVVRDPIQVGTTYVAGSLRVDGVAMTDAAGDDVAEVVTSEGVTSVVARLGSGADASSGGRVAIDAFSVVTFDVTVTGAAGSTVSNTGRLAYRAVTLGRDISTATNTVVTPIAEDPEPPTPGGEPDLTVDKLAPERVPAGDPVTYTVKVRSSGAVDATNVVLTDRVPVGVTIEAIDDDCTLDAAVITCALGTMAAGTSWVGEFVGRIDPSLAGETRLVNEVTATADGGVAASDSVRTTVVGLVDLSVTVDPVAPDLSGGEGDLRLTVTNDTDRDADDVEVSVSLPDGLDLRDDATDVCAADRDEETVSVTCAIGTVPATSSVDVVVPVRVTGGSVVAGATEITVAVSGTGIDLDPAGDSAVVGLAQQPAPVTLPATGPSDGVRWLGVAAVLAGLVLAVSTRSRRRTI